MVKWAQVVALVTWGVMLGCSSGTQTAGATSTPAVRHSRDLITREEVQQAPGGSAYEVVTHYHPDWLVQRSADVGIPIYVDGRKWGMGDEGLRNVPAETIKEIRHLNARDATQRYGTGNASGAIEIETIR